MEASLSNDDRKELYLSGGGVTCPYCGSENLSTGPIDTQDDGKHQYVWCDDCQQEWQDIYTLADVIFEE